MASGGIQAVVLSRVLALASEDKVREDREVDGAHRTILHRQQPSDYEVRRGVRGRGAAVKYLAHNASRNADQLD
jgi:hypothetical protein